LRSNLLGLSMFAAIVVGVSCATPPPPSHPVALYGTPVPAYQSIVPTETFVCVGGQFIPPVIGALAGDPTDPQLVWIVAPNGQRLDVRWPPGFAVRFEPRLELVSDKGVLVGLGGQRIEINADPSAHAGSPEDPFVANQINGACYAPVAGP
jgi:hypothetical protein